MAPGHAGRRQRRRDPVLKTHHAYDEDRPGVGHAS
jgi:hypothetical protein